ncbi:sensor histidine kinase [Deinococcus maricopensis]|uniref:histidine kinase n=1 Tax=Deinococcus maricopensis (strain DSM 21211 / LMG 22137 / NRRL B-23946 / LB-34) TaxID=709986 RepID=E8U5A5_DEIML|nr:HAMP domain-containing sensor histidine kinase [Deinococcus maricopensis]ADV66244.1 integral membrane sensor signal transduction histidine kinase [Deinococcus maricopensis DSM 21211]
MTLRWRLTFFYATLVTTLLVVLGVSLTGVMQRRLLDNVDSDLLETYGQFMRLNDLASQPTYGPPNGNPFQPLDDQTRLQQIGESSFPATPLQVDLLIGQSVESVRTLPVDLLQQIARQGRQLWQINPDRPIELTGPQWTKLQRSPERNLKFTAALPALYQQAARPVRIFVALGDYSYAPSASLGSGSEKTTAVVYVARDLTNVYETIDNLRLITFVVFLIGALGAGVGAYVFSGQALKPLRQVQQAAEGIGGRTLAQRVPEPDTGDEVQSLARALNGMLDRLEASFEAQRRFTSDASHELRTPVTAISGHAGYLLRRTQPTDQQRESLGIIKSEADRLTGLIGSLLELARSDSGVLQLRLQPVLSCLFLQDIARELRPLAQAQGATLTPEGEEIPFQGDPDRLRQVLINLVSNALKAGSHAITLRSARDPNPSGPPSVRLSVQDDGPGIAPEHLGRLFDRFYRVEESRSRDQGGAGLGLAIVKSIVDAHHGQIWVESEVGVGTTVHVRLPIGNVPDLDPDDVA